MSGENRLFQVRRYETVKTRSQEWALGWKTGQGRKKRHRPTHINIKYRASIRNKDFLRILKSHAVAGPILNSRKKGLRIIHYSVLSNHVHFIIEADNNNLLTKGMRSLTISLTRGINKGRVQIQRYHLHVLKSLRETRNAVRYVVFNEEKHSEKRIIDSYSSVSKYVTKLDEAKSFLLSSQSS